MRSSIVLVRSNTMRSAQPPCRERPRRRALGPSRQKKRANRARAPGVPRAPSPTRRARWRLVRWNRGDVRRRGVARGGTMWHCSNGSTVPRWCGRCVMQNAKSPVPFALVVGPSDSSSKPAILLYVARNSGAPQQQRKQLRFFFSFFFAFCFCVFFALLAQASAAQRSEESRPAI